MNEQSVPLELDPIYTISSRRKSSQVDGATEIKAIYSTSPIVLHDTLVAFLSFIKHFNVPILPVTLPDVRTVLGQGASFLVNGAEVPKDYVDPVTGNKTHQGTVVAMKRAKLRQGMHRPVADRIGVVHNELLTLMHPPLAAHPNIVDLLGVSFEVEGVLGNERVLPILITECAELGNLADVLETARKEDRPLSFEDKISLCLDIAHGIEILHACDIVHGDVKCENVLVFEKRDHKTQDVKLYAKLTDFGAVQLANGNFELGGTPPWRAPEMLRETAFKVDAAKRIDNFSFGMLLWRVCLDGDPFQTLGHIPGDKQERRRKRNELITEKKIAGTLISHVCESLALSDKFTKQQLKMLCDVISITLPTNATQRELHISQMIRLLTYESYYNERHPLPPSRMPADVQLDLINFEKWYSEFEGLNTLVQSAIVADLCDYAQPSASAVRSWDEIEKKTAAAYQLAICYANGFGGTFEPGESLKWLSIASKQGFTDAQNALKSFQEAFPDVRYDVDSPSTLQLASDEDDKSTSNSSWVWEFPIRSIKEGDESDQTPKSAGVTEWLAAAQSGDYKSLDRLLDGRTKILPSADGVTPLHFLSSWDIERAEDLGKRLVKAGADVNAIAAHGTTRGGTPLMWSVFGNHIKHTQILLDLGADPFTATSTNEDALGFAAKLHLVEHLRLLMEYIQPKKFHGHLQRLIEAAAGGDSRFTRINRHGANWQAAATGTFDLLKGWHETFPDAADFSTAVLAAVHAGVVSPFGRVNTDVQIEFIKHAAISPPELQGLLRESLVSYNKDLFERLLQLHVPLDGKFEQGRTLLHLCARIPSDRVAALDFAPRLLERGIDLERKDDKGLTPWMDAVLERKWDLADLFLNHGADPLQIDADGFNVMGLCIRTLNLGAFKFLLKYAKDDKFAQQFTLVNDRRRMSPLQLVASIPLPRAHGMKVEVLGTFLITLEYYGKTASQIHFRSDSICVDATALDIAVSKGVLHAVWYLVKEEKSTIPRKERLIALAKANMLEAEDYLQRKNYERCLYILENWDKDRNKVNMLAADWINLRTLDESVVAASWEYVVWDQSDRRIYVKGR